MKTTRTLEIDGNHYALTNQVTDTELIQLITLLMKAGLQKMDTGYIPGTDSRYHETVMYTAGKQVDLKLGITANDLISREDFLQRREAGEKLYNAANPGAKEGA